MKLPGPGHPIAIEPSSARIRVRVGNIIVADTTRALALREAHYPVVYYIPRDDTDMSLLTATDHSTHCPYKGDASYFTISADGRDAVNAVWSYRKPYPAMAAIKDYLAFYPNRVDAIEITPSS